MMTPHRALADADEDSTAKHLDGEARAHRAATLAFGDPDSITRAITNLLAEDGVVVPITPRLLGFGRVLRKMLEARE